MLDEDAFRRFVEWQIAEGTHGLVPVGTTGRESDAVARGAYAASSSSRVETAQKRVPVIAGAGSNSTAEAIEFTARQASRGGCGARRHALL